MLRISNAVFANTLLETAWQQNVNAIGCLSFKLCNFSVSSVLYIDIYARLSKRCDM